MNKFKYVNNIKPRFISHFPSYVYQGHIDPNVHLFTEDINLGVIPIDGISHNKPEFDIKLTGDMANELKIIQTLNSISEYKSKDIKKLVCDVIYMISSHLSWYGKCYYEIINDSNSNNFVLNNFPGHHLLKILNFYIQLPPLKDYKYVKKRVITLSSKHVWLIEIPKALGGYNNFKYILKNLSTYNILGPKFYQRDLSRLKENTNFEFMRYVSNIDIFLLHLTNQWGWIKGDYSQKNKTEFYTLYRLIKFSWAKTVLREHIITEINKLFSRLGYSNEICIYGLPTSKDLLDIQRKVLSGGIKLSEIHDLITIV